MKIHQISWSKKSFSTLQARRLSCTDCQPEEDCKHFGIGSIKFSHEQHSRKRLRYSDVFSDSEEEPLEPSHNINDFEDITIGDWVAVIYDDKWYPGVVERVGEAGENFLSVNFMARSGANFTWPTKPDTQTVEKKDVLKKIRTPPFPVSSRHFGLDSQSIRQIEDLYNMI
ncbi:uncharacterized protein LOC111061905 isoform X2 [Nilaparvata lugens]|nr:uncharacterized protein LOC111061905 isoform X2 [Nilaparvata lugens]